MRSANLAEGFIPIYQTSSNKLLFADIRLYNPNGTPLEGNIELGFRRLFHQGRRLLGFYGGYDITPSLTVYDGGYYFDHSDTHSIAGPKLRATYTRQI